MTPVSAHFALEEFGCHDGTPYPAEWIEERLRPLCETLEVIREATGGKPIHIDSGFRTLKYDEALYQKSIARGLGGKADPRSSQHPKGRAADIRCGSLTSTQLQKLIGELYQAGKLPHLGGLGWYPSFVHIDVRPRVGGHLAQWGGSRLSNIA